MDSYKSRGIPLGKIAVAMCVHSLMGCNSMNDCSSWLSDPNVLKASGIIGKHTDDIIKVLWKGINSMFDLPDTDVNIGGSAVTMYGPRSELGDYRHPRDKNDEKEQVEFTVANLRTSGIPFYVKAFEGNTSDPEQYRTVLPDIFGMLREGSWIVMDNGGSAGTYWAA